MKVSGEEKDEFFRRKQVLEQAKTRLKTEFVGLDDIIDEVIDLIEPWYLFPKGQIRPTIVNLWGMTGVGKTSLIKRLFEHLEMKDSLYKFDVGDYASQDNTKLSYSFSESLKNREKHQIGLIFDEFQLGRTIDETGAELEKSGLRAMWDLLDSGKISILQSSYYGTKVYQLTLKIEDCIDNGGVEAKNGKITKNKDYHEKYFKIENNPLDIVAPKNKSKTKGKAKEKEDPMLIPEDFLWYIQTIWENRYITERELREHLKTLDHTSTVVFLNDTLHRAFKPMEFDYSSSCIFVIGNIDEAYRMAKNFDPDSDADRFYRHSLKITLPQIKSALQKRFRAEQIARLGNSHIIYPAFSSKVYRELIALELSKAEAKIKEKFDIVAKFDKSINTIIYREGVFPSQGARPVFTTITALIESYIGKMIKDILNSGQSVAFIKWSFSNKKHTIKFLDENKKELFKKSYSVRLKIENLRESEGSELQAQVAIHEAGHAVAAIYGANVLPTEIVSRTANMSEGHCAVEIPSTSIETRENLEKDILICLGGYVAEKIIFGENRVSDGTYGDFQRATNIALDMAKTHGMSGGGAPMFYGHKSANTNFQWNSSKVNTMDDLAEQIVRNAEEKCKKILEENKYLLLKIGEYLSVNSRMDSKKLKQFVDEFGNEVELKDKSNYHSFKSTIAEKLSESESEFRPRKGLLKRYASQKLKEIKA
ncbi:MAG: hypothetical protein AABY15_05480 [Nanoarchaeota archaeon]